MEWFRIAAALIVTAVLAGCGSSDLSPIAVEKHVHENGLQLFIPKTCQATTTQAGFLIEPRNKHDLRYPFSVSIELLPARPRITMYRVRYLGSGRIVWYSSPVSCGRSRRG
jgi:hypothetical protein